MPSIPCTTHNAAGAHSTSAGPTACGLQHSYSSSNPAPHPHSLGEGEAYSDGAGVALLCHHQVSPQPVQTQHLGRGCIQPCIDKEITYQDKANHCIAQALTTAYPYPLLALVAATEVACHCALLAGAAANAQCTLTPAVTHTNSASQLHPVWQGQPASVRIGYKHTCGHAGDAVHVPYTPLLL
jgi:hypothetical protein